MPRLKILLYGSLFTLLLFSFSWVYCFIRVGVPHVTTAQLWDHWDTTRYLAIANDGYQTSSEHWINIAFLPLYPFLIRVLSTVTRSPMWSALLISNIAYLGAMLFLHEAAKRETSPKAALRTVLWMSIFPSAFFLHAGYTESLFLLFAIPACTLATEGRWGSAGILAGLACATRMNGIVLIPCFAAEYWFQKRKRAVPFVFPAMACLLATAGLAIYCYINFKVFGQPFRFLAAQKEGWQRSVSFPWNGLFRELSILRIPGAAPAGKLMAATNVLSAFVGLGLSLEALRRFRPAFGVFSIMTMAVFLCSTTWMSMPRLLLENFPIFFLIAEWSESETVAWPLATGCILFLSFFTGEFVLNRWAG